ncbi:probable CCR4-associated factor 1 homolog 7 [Elaeis guineensis]|uniref:poly(A)-specific ribonuclease n=1 Tax=Elaeis guineensis var. tenera TaxID=51953 RepID=A0A6I9RU35_ELAGV|nr:probable CCR4-associated factor 1 homolog 7 [Elaeis guineensis]
MSIPAKSDESVEIREVWADNLEVEFAVIREIVDEYPFIAMDTEFPGVAITPVRAFKNISDQHYQTLRANVDLLHLIQVGITFSDASGCLPPSPSGGGLRCVWQFNFREFDPDRDVSNPDSIDLLRRSGIDFVKNREQGIDALRFAELLMSSGVVLNDSVQWIAFHGAYDFAYLLKILTCRRLPESLEEFFELVGAFFPIVYDIKHLMRFCNNLYGGLNKVAEQVDAERIGVCHQAGSDSLLTARVFWRLKENYFDGSIERYAGCLYGLET